MRVQRKREKWWEGERDLLAMHCDGHVPRLPLHALQLVNQVDHGPAVSRGRGLAPLGEMELTDHTALLRLCTQHTYAFKTDDPLPDHIISPDGGSSK